MSRIKRYYQVSYDDDNDEFDSLFRIVYDSPTLALKRFKKLKFSNPALWKASVKRAKFVIDCANKERKIYSAALAFGRFSKEKTFIDPSTTNVIDAITALISDIREREKYIVFYKKILRTYRNFINKI